MTLRFLQGADSYLGKPALWLMRAFRSQRKFIGGNCRTSPPSVVVITKLIGLGSIVLSTPLLRSLRSSGTKVIFLTLPGNASLLRSLGCADEVLTIDPSARRVVISSLSVLFRLWRAKPDAFVDLEPTSHLTALLGILTLTRQRIGLLSGNPLKESAFTHLVALTAQRHMSENFSIVAKLLGVGMTPEESAQLPKLSLPHSYEHVPGHDWSGKKIVLNMTTSDLGSYHRSWPAHHWRTLALALLADESTLLILPGLASDWKKLEEFRSKVSDPARVLNLAGKTSLNQLMHVLRDAQLVVSLDSGIAHLAAWVDTPLVCLFGPESPTLYRPLAKRMSVIWRGLHCSPCCTIATEKHTRCRDNQCMKRISPDEVLQACYKYIDLKVVALPKDSSR